MSISYYIEQIIMLLGRENIVLAIEDQEEINLYNYYIKNINLKQDFEQGWHANKWWNLSFPQKQALGCKFPKKD